jgi:hypothetical protein
MWDAHPPRCGRFAASFSLGLLRLSPIDHPAIKLAVRDLLQPANRKTAARTNGGGDDQTDQRPHYSVAHVVLFDNKLQCAVPGQYPSQTKRLILLHLHPLPPPQWRTGQLLAKTGGKTNE